MKGAGRIGVQVAADARLLVPRHSVHAVLAWPAERSVCQRHATSNTADVSWRIERGHFKGQTSETSQNGQFQWKNETPTDQCQFHLIRKVRHRRFPATACTEQTKHFNEWLDSQLPFYPRTAV